MIYGLACEWKNAIWVLSSAERKLMKIPLFSLKDMKSRLGCWSGEKQEICLSRTLLYRHAWDAVREILLHEMAHQFTEQVLGVFDETPHGPCFQKACRHLRANPKATESGPFLSEKGIGRETAPDDRIRIRVKKLMALAESKNRHEAEAAMLKAQALVRKYNLSLLAEGRDRDFISLFLGRPRLRHYREEYLLASIIQDFYFVQGVWISAYVLEKSKMGRVLEISGASQNVRMAEYVYAFVKHFIDVQWQAYNAGKNLNRFRKTDFAAGILEGFRITLKRSETRCPERTERFALVEIDDPQLKQYLAYKYPRTVTLRKDASGHDRGVFEDGRRIGRTLVLHKGISERKVSRKRIAG